MSKCRSIPDPSVLRLILYSNTIFMCDNNNDTYHENNKNIFFYLISSFPPHSCNDDKKSLSSPRANLPNVFHSLLSSFFFIVVVVCCPFPSSEKLKNSFIVLRSLCLSSLHSIFLISPRLSEGIFEMIQQQNVIEEVMALELLCPLFSRFVFLC